MRDRTKRSIDLEAGENGFQRRPPKFVPKKRGQILAVGIATLGTFTLGAVLNWSAPVLPDLEKSQDLGDVSVSKSWMTSLAFLGALISAPVSGFLMNLVGRRRAMTLVAIPFILGWLMIAAAKPFTSVLLVCIGRVIIGFCGASYLVFVPVYVGETATKQIRGALSTLMILMLVTGVLFVYILGTIFPWYLLSGICGIPPLLILIFMPLMPETPRYLISRSDLDGAAESLLWLRGAQTKAQIQPELLRIQESFGYDQEDSSKLSDLFALSSLKPTLISLILIFFQQTCGAVTVSLYTVQVFESAKTNLNPNLASIIISICEVLTVFVPTFLVDKVGRKVLLLVSEGIMIASLAALSIYYYFQEAGDAESLAWLPLPAFIIFTIGYNCGMGPIPFVVVSEILPSQSRALGQSIVTAFYWILIFTSAQTFDLMINALGWGASYGLFTVICIFGTIYIIFIVPETKGKSTEDLDLKFGRKTTVRRVSLRNSLVERGAGSGAMPEAATTGAVGNGEVTLTRTQGVSNLAFEDEKL